MEVSQGGDGYGGRGPEILGVSWALIGVTTIFILLRLYTRFFTGQQSYRSEDGWSLVWTLLTWIFGVIGTSFLSVAVHYGFGNHVADIVFQGSLSKAILYALIWFTLYTLMIVWAKVSVVALLFEVQQPVHKIQKFVLITLVVISLCANIVNIFLIWFQCNPSKKIWEPLATGECGLVNVTYDYSIFTGSWSALVDLYLSLYSFFIVVTRPISGKLKLLSTVLLALGIFTCVCACMRTYELHKIKQSSDKTWDSALFVLWSAAECWIVVIVSSTPSIWPLMQDQLSFLELSSGASSEQGDGEKQGPEADGRHVSARSYATTATNYTTRTSATTATTSTNATTATNVTSATNTLTLSGSTAGQELDGAIAVRHEVTVDREARRRSQGFRPRADTRSWARVDVDGLARWDSDRAAISPSWARRPSWSRRPSLTRTVSSTLSRLNSSATGSNTWARKPSLPGIAQ